MNLHGIVSPYISAVNPSIICTLERSIGHTIPDDGPGIATPEFARFPNLSCQIQPLSSSDLQHTDGLNITSYHKAIYISGPLKGANRTEVRGGDVLLMPNGTQWKIVQVIEAWTDWTKAVGVQI